MARMHKYQVNASARSSIAAAIQPGLRYRSRARAVATHACASSRDVRVWLRGYRVRQWMLSSSKTLQRNRAPKRTSQGYINRAGTSDRYNDRPLPSSFDIDAVLSSDYSTETSPPASNPHLRCDHPLTTPQDFLSSSKHKIRCPDLHCRVCPWTYMLVPVAMVYMSRCW